MSCLKSAAGGLSSESGKPPRLMSGDLSLRANMRNLRRKQPGVTTGKKGRHRRYEEARALKRSNEGDFESLLDDFVDDDEDVKPEHAAWAEEFDADDD